MERVPTGADVLVLAGVPGTDAATSADELGRYPTMTSDAVKILREHDLNVEYAHPKDRRVHDIRKGAETWIPVLLFAQSVLASAAGQLLAEMILELVGGRDKLPRARLHVRCGFETDGETRWFEAHGDGSDVLEALREFNKESD